MIEGVCWSLIDGPHYTNFLLFIFHCRKNILEVDFVLIEAYRVKCTCLNEKNFPFNFAKQSSTLFFCLQSLIFAIKSLKLLISRFIMYLVCG